MDGTFKVVIPARYASSRLPGKPLLKIAGKEMILHVCEKAALAGAEEVVVATDDKRILECVKLAGFNAVMTLESHTSGTERLTEVANTLEWVDDTVIVNCQGDEPLIPPELIKKAATALMEQTTAQVASLCAPIKDVNEVLNPNAVKVVRDAKDYALYFSRAPIPWDRDCFPDNASSFQQEHFRHIGIYSYTAGFLRRYITWPVCALEQIESLEQLRILYQGERILVPAVDQVPEAGVDTQEDLDRINDLFA
ncbi:MAG TPA: 3-deoxy-manno-octulosonate cytidylyltransferase [Cycloclasticus sp.]|jgi:3-deoxy-manno-octulosonate cytidylyltransferase (CMP-KDO synthetase)|nr:3-deoxy-manno-octulosonate cytidylyltransferase [Cycloclasticus sp.]HIL91381.1 3-deoxy-manno-octulosonate cytidylyltransferase [Cycloclasticus sp.]